MITVVCKMILMPLIPIAEGHVICTTQLVLFSDTNHLLCIPFHIQIQHCTNLLTLSGA